LRHKPISSAIKRHDTANRTGFLANAGGKGDHQATPLQVDAQFVKAAAQQNGL
jgi:hypothetical protein